MNIKEKILMAVSIISYAVFCLKKKNSIFLGVI